MQIALENDSEVEAMCVMANQVQDIIKISEAMTYEKYIDDVLNLIVTVTATITQITTCSLWLIDKRENPLTIRLKTSRGIDTDLFYHKSLALNQGVVGMVATYKKPLIIADVLKDRQFKEKDMARRSGIVSMLGVPIVYKNDKLLGVLNCFTTKPHEFSKTEVNLMSNLADQAAISIFNTELMVRAELAKEELNTHDLLMRANNVLMQQRKIAADEASDWIQQCSDASCMSLRHVAEAILLTCPLPHNTSYFS
ncbi:predicted antitermination regulatory protein, ANTAR and GAF domain [Desulfobacula toluolica Tol2]|uniref:Predicted antitermination regulatory protein, ANTAR and GAF domain n=1 Tax=Desulfobacula toluolica (strain DSM 7467 / Tol2) TaxID=651182 RepID=K0NCH5_DESTT|nr:predicted antitermination regulatory protein, ANTAR and GAF domain [Desulfobacula toluolica Tol2]